MAAVAGVATVEEIDAQLAQAWRLLLTASKHSQALVWEQIDELLDQRLELTASR